MSVDEVPSGVVFVILAAATAEAQSWTSESPLHASQQCQTADIRFLLEGFGPSNSRILASLQQQAKHGHAVGRANIDSSIRDNRRDEFVARELVAAVSGLVGVVELGRQIRGIVGVQDSCTPVFNRPYNAVGNAVWGNAWRRSWILKQVWALR